MCKHADEEQDIDCHHWMQSSIFCIEIEKKSFIDDLKEVIRVVTNK